MKTKPKYTIFYGYDKLTCFTGTKRAIINRLKKLNIVTWADTLEVEGFKHPEDLFTLVEMDEMRNMFTLVEMDDENNNLVMQPNEQQPTPCQQPQANAAKVLSLQGIPLLDSFNAFPYESLKLSNSDCDYVNRVIGTVTHVNPFAAPTIINHSRFHQISVDNTELMVNPIQCYMEKNNDTVDALPAEGSIVVLRKDALYVKQESHIICSIWRPALFEFAKQTSAIKRSSVDVDFNFADYGYDRKSGYLPNMEENYPYSLLAYNELFLLLFSWKTQVLSYHRHLIPTLTQQSLTQQFTTPSIVLLTVTDENDGVIDMTPIDFESAARRYNTIKIQNKTTDVS